MVSVNTAADIVLADAVRSHRQHLDAATESDDLLAALTAWLLAGTGTQIVVDDLVRVHAGRHGAERTYRDVGLLGFCIAAGADPDLASVAFVGGIRWIAGRQVDFADGPLGVAVDAIALLGMVAGVEQGGNSELAIELRTWLNSFLSKSAELPALEDWQRSLFQTLHAYATQSAGLWGTGASAPASDVAVALHCLAPFSGLQIRIQEDTLLDCLQELRSGASRDVDVYRLPLMLAAYDWICRSSPTINPLAPTVDAVLAMLQNLERGMERWTWEETPRTKRQGGQAEKWQIDNEYHFQNLLWTVLAPIFPDLRDEEYTESIAQLQPKADLEVPSLKLIVEVKYLYERDRPQKIIEELAADSALYRSGERSDWSLLPVIWDDGRRSEMHGTLRQGITKLPGVVDAVIIARPGKMQR